MERSRAARARSSCFLSTANSALRIHSASLSAFSFCFFSSTCWSAMAMATWVFTCMSWFRISRVTCLIIFSGSSARSIRSFRLARINVDTLSNKAIQTSYLLVKSLLGLFVRLGRLVSNHLHLGKQLRELHSGKRLEQCGDLRGHSGHVARDLVHARGTAVARGHDRDLVDVGKRGSERLDDLGHVADELVDDRRLVVFLVGFGLHIHSLCFGFALLENISASASPVARVEAAWPSASKINFCFWASASISILRRSISACLSTVAINSRSRRWISASCTAICPVFCTCSILTCSAITCCCITLV